MSRVFIIAGTNDILQTLAGQLGSGDEVRLLESANETLWEVQSNPPEVLLADMDLPDMTGVDLAEILGNFDAPTRVIIWSRTSNPKAAQQATGSGVFRFLEGAQSLDALQTLVQAAIAAPPPAPTPPPPPAPTPPPPPAPTPPAPRSVRPPPSPRPSPPPPPPPAPVREERQRDFVPARVTLPTAAERAAAERTAAADERAAERAAAERAAVERAAERATTEQAATERAAAERAAANPPHRGGLAARAASSRATPRAEPTPPPDAPATHEDSPFSSQRRRDGTIVLTDKNIAPIRTSMSQLMQNLGAQCIMLTNREGMILADVGDKGKLPLMILLPLLSTSFSTAGEVSRLLQEKEATTLYIHEGTNYDLYCFDVVQRFFLVLVFNKKIAGAKIGSVWIDAKRAIRELRTALG